MTRSHSASLTSAVAVMRVHDSGVVDEHAEVAEGLDGGGDDLVDRALVAEVADDRAGGAAVRLYLLGDGLGADRIDVRDKNFGPQVREPQGGGVRCRTRRR